MYLLDQNSLGGYTKSGPNNDLDEVQIGGCWCGQSYFATKGLHQSIVASGGNNVMVWKVENSGSVKLVLTGTSPGLPGAQDPGFFTSVSSARNGRNAIIWALARPQTAPGTMTLFAFTSGPHRGSSLKTLYQATAGYWASPNADANLVPVVANGKVYVASYQQLEIFGLGGTAANATAARAHAVALRSTINAPSEVTGTLLTVRGSLLTLRTRTGKLVQVDDSDAARHERIGDLVAGKPFNARGKYDAAGVLHAVAIVRAKPSEASWPADR
jgi:hypothetical protein